MKKWWTNSEQKLHYAEYSVEGTTVLVGNRPNYNGTTPEFFNSVDGWINVSDRFVLVPKGPLTLWAPWNEAGKPNYETIFAVVRTLHHWISTLKLKKIYIHCDGGTHRAVSLFGFYLNAYQNENKEKINSNYKLVNREHWSNPLQYADSYFKELEELPLVLKKLTETPDDDQYGVSLDTILSDKSLKKAVAEYKIERSITKSIPWEIQSIWHNLKFSGWYALKRPFQKIYREIHKKLNTKYGKALKKYKL